jgi:hypothetical protein
MVGGSPHVSRRRGWFGRLCADILLVARRDKKWWVLPLVLVLLMLGGLLAFVSFAGPLAPFIYPLL